jgi:hypothetical protein
MDITKPFPKHFQQIFYFAYILHTLLSPSLKIGTYRTYKYTVLLKLLICDTQGLNSEKCRK